MKVGFSVLLAIVASSAAQAQDAKSVVQTSIGVPVEKWSNDFAGHYEFASPEVHFAVPRGFGDQTAVISLTKDGGKVEGPRILVMLAYNGDWQFYNSAVFKGGEPIAFTESQHRVIGCEGGCTESESFFLTPTKAQLAKYAADGNLTFQIQSKTATNAIITIPMAYYAAVLEAAK
jgi:hypothetical protein